MCRGTGQTVEGGGGEQALICFETYNIQNSQNSGLDLALRGTSQPSVDVGVFQETKLTEGIYTGLSEGYMVITTPAPSQHQCGVATLYQDSPVFTVEAIQQFGAKVIACQLATGERRWYIMDCYLVPGYGTTIRDVEAAKAEKPRGAEMIVAGDLNVEMRKKGSMGRGKEITVLVETAGLEDMVGHFFPRRRVWCRDWRTWAMR